MRPVGAQLPALVLGGDLPGVVPGDDVRATTRVRRALLDGEPLSLTSADVGHQVRVVRAAGAVDVVADLAGRHGSASSSGSASGWLAKAEASADASAVSTWWPR